MTKAEAIALIDAQKNTVIHPLELLRWTWLRVIINQIPDHSWNMSVVAAEEIMSR